MNMRIDGVLRTVKYQVLPNQVRVSIDGEDFLLEADNAQPYMNKNCSAFEPHMLKQLAHDILYGQVETLALT